MDKLEFKEEVLKLLTSKCPTTFVAYWDYSIHMQEAAMEIESLFPEVKISGKYKWGCSITSPTGARLRMLCIRQATPEQAFVEKIRGCQLSTVYFCDMFPTDFQRLYALSRVRRIKGFDQEDIEKINMVSWHSY